MSLVGLLGLNGKEPGRFFDLEGIKDCLLVGRKLRTLQDPAVRSLELAQMKLGHGCADVPPGLARFELSCSNHKKRQPAKENMSADAVA